MELTTIPDSVADAGTRSDAFAASSWHMMSMGVLAVLWSGLCFAHFGLTGTGSTIAGGWTQAFLGAALWGGFAGGVLLLLRSRWAVQAWTTALVGVMATSASLFVFAREPANLYAMPMMLGLWVITLAMLLYVSRVHVRGLLR